MARVLALIGGESTGKSTLATQLADQLTHGYGLRCIRVDEHLREWCSAAGRAPLIEEQAALATRQAALIAEAQARQDIDWVIADTTALVIAAYSQQYFSDPSLWTLALAQQRTYALTLLLGQDLPWVPDGLFRDSPKARAETDRLLRQAMQSAGLSFQTIYGQGEQRQQQALRALGHLIGQPLGSPAPEWGKGRYTWQCERCSDPACEHRLFSRLTGKTAD